MKIRPLLAILSVGSLAYFASLQMGNALAAEDDVPAAVSGLDWDEVAFCRSGSNWQHPPVRMNQSGFGYSGGLMLFWPAWQAYGGTEYAPLPHEATREEQIAVAEQIVADPATGGKEFAESLGHCEEMMPTQGEGNG